MDATVYSDYFALEKSHWWFAGRRRILESVLRRALKEPVGSACDIGCGAGENIPMLSKAAASVSGIEMEPKAAVRAKERYPSLSVRIGVFPQLVPLSGTDLVTMFDVLEHIEDDVGALKRVRESLSDDGLLICTVPAFMFLWGGHDELVHHKRRYTAATLRAAMEKAGFDVRRMTYFNSLLLFPTALFRIIKRKVQKEKPTSDLFAFPPAVNAFLREVFAAERFPMRLCDLPFGVSLVCVARAKRSAEVRVDAEKPSLASGI